MPNPHDDFFDLPEYPVRPASPSLRLGAPDSVWARYPMGSRIVAALAITCLLAPVVAFFRGNGGPTASAETAMIDGAVLDVTAGPDVSVADKPAEVTAAAATAAAEGTLPPTVATPATLPRTTPTTEPVKKAAVAPQTSTVQVVKPSTATTAKRPATTAKPVVKPAATTQATSKAAATTAAPVVKAPAASTTPRTTRPQAVTSTEAPAAPAQVWSTDEVEALIRQMWPADSLEKALRVAFRESRYQADAYNGWCCYGVFQINGASHKHRLAARGLAVKDLLDPRVNIEIALELYNEQGWGPWGG